MGRCLQRFTFVFCSRENGRVHSISSVLADGVHGFYARGGPHGGCLVYVAARQKLEYRSWYVCISFVLYHEVYLWCKGVAFRCHGVTSYFIPVRQMRVAFPVYLFCGGKDGEEFGLCKRRNNRVG